MAREGRVRRRVTNTAMPTAIPVRASVKSVTFVTAIAFSVGATAASNANSSVNAAAARTLSRRQNQNVLPRNRAANTAAAAGNEIQKMSTVSQIAKVRPARRRAIRALSIGCSFRDLARLRLASGVARARSQRWLCDPCGRRIGTPYEQDRGDNEPEPPDE